MNVNERPQRDRMYLTTLELAQGLDVSAETVRRWRRDGRIRPSFITPGGSPRWTLPPLGLEVWD